MITLEGSIINVITGEIYPGNVSFSGEMIEGVERTGDALPLTLKNAKKLKGPFILPGLVDGHIHIESSMLTPSRFGQVAVSHGTTSVVSDPHEIANVMGVKGLRYMLLDGKNSPVNVYYTVPSCVPATDFETSGGRIDARAVEKLLTLREFVALGEMMNYPGVIEGDPEVLEKLEAARKAGKPIDGHAPLLSGKDLNKYIGAGITTDHECTNLEEAMEKARLGMKIQVRQGSAARNLVDLLGMYGLPGVMTVSDDRSPGELLEGHMDALLKLLVQKKIPLDRALRSMTLTPCEHYGINSGALVPGRLADIIVVEDIAKFKVTATYVKGSKVFEGEGLPTVEPVGLDYTPLVRPVTASELMVAADDEDSNYRVRVIEVTDGRIMTAEREEVLKARDGFLVPDIKKDILPLVVIDRHEGKHIGRGFVKGFGIKNGALCSSIAHDSHNIICVGSGYDQMVRAIGRVMGTGGVGAVSGIMLAFLPLPVGGLMSDLAVDEVAEDLTWVRDIVKLSGCKLRSPVITLSFLSLLVVPSLKLSDRGLFSTATFDFIDVIIEKM